MSHDDGKIIRLADRRTNRPKDFRQRDPIKGLIAILVTTCVVAALVAMNRYL